MQELVYTLSLHFKKREERIMLLVDTHTHIYMDAFDEDRDEVVRRAMDNGIQYMVLPNVDLETIAPLRELVEAYPGQMLPAMGLHPTSVKADYKDVLKKIEQELNTNTYYAIGEIGIDLYWDKTYRKEQEEVFAKQIEWGIERDMPIIIHARKSYNEIFKVLKLYANRGLRGVFHCFTGSKEQADQIAEMGFYMGIGGVLTFKNAKLGDSIKDLGLEHFIFETDAPYLAPVPYRGKRNQPAYIRLIARKMADLFQVDIEKVAEITTNNANNLFKFIKK